MLYCIICYTVSYAILYFRQKNLHFWKYYWILTATVWVWTTMFKSWVEKMTIFGIGSGHFFFQTSNTTCNHICSTTWSIDTSSNLSIDPFFSESVKGIQSLWWCSWWNFSFVILSHGKGNENILEAKIFYYLSYSENFRVDFFEKSIKSKNLTFSWFKFVGLYLATAGDDLMKISSRSCILYSGISGVWHQRAHNNNDGTIIYGGPTDSPHKPKQNTERKFGFLWINLQSFTVFMAKC